jgi:hypothetical protein
LRLPDDLDALERLVEEREAQLVVIDPLVAYLPAEVNSWRDQSVRWALAPLRLLAQRQDCAVLAVVHLNKAFSTDALKRIGGSVGIGAAARSVLLLARDPEDPDGDSGSQRVLAHVKSNLSELASSLSYVIDPVLIPALNGFPEVRTAKIAGTGESVHSGQDLLAGRDDEEQGALAEAIEFLRVELVEGKRSAKAVKQAAKDAGVSEKTLSRAAKRLGVKKEKDGFQGTWLWGIPKGGQQDWPPLNDGQDGHLCGSPHETGDSGPLRESETAKDGQLSDMAIFDGMSGFSFLPGLA